MRKAFSLAFLALFLFPLVSFSQEKDDLGCASEEGKKLSFLTGKWRVKSKFRTGSEPDKWEETTGTSEIKFLFEDCLAQEKLEIKRGGRPLTVIALYSYNNFSDMYQWTFAHSEHGLLTFYEGPLEGDRFTFRSETKAGGRKISFERLLTKTAKGFDLTAQRSSDGGKTWRVDWYLSYTR
ncbi:MAG: DUF1579 family protein [Pyrinomonadaceae bacterium]